jgi:hypothetical protein
MLHWKLLFIAIVVVLLYLYMMAMAVIVHTDTVKICTGDICIEIDKDVL